MTRTAPFRADHVGSLLRPAAVQAARERYHADALGPDGFHTSAELRAVEDEAIRDVVAMQESVGLMAVTDGEYRRSFWHYDFMGALTGLELVERDEGVQFSGMKLRPVFPTITGRLDFPDDHPMLDHFRYLASIANGASQDLDSGSKRVSLPNAAQRHYTSRICRHCSVVFRSDENLSQSRTGLLRCGLSIPPDG